MGLGKAAGWAATYGRMGKGRLSSPRAEERWQVDPPINALLARVRLAHPSENLPPAVAVFLKVDSYGNVLSLMGIPNPDVATVRAFLELEKMAGVAVESTTPDTFFPSSVPPSPEEISHRKTLGLPPDATFDEIKKAYRTLAKELHPDRNPDPASVKRFVAVARAYEELENLPRE